MTTETETAMSTQEALAEAIAKAEAELKALKERAKQTKQDRIAALVAKVKPAVEAAGIKLPEFARALNPGKPRPVLALKSDPTKTWSRGIMPGWMTDAMKAAGYDPTMAASREKFRSEQMTVIG